MYMAWMIVAAVGAITPTSLVGELAVYPFGMSLAEKSPYRITVSKITQGIILTICVINERVIGYLRLIIRICVNEIVGLNAEKRIMFKEQGSSKG